jgi:uncharacterized protein (TIGR03000 family)
LAAYGFQSKGMKMRNTGIALAALLAGLGAWLGDVQTVRAESGDAPVVINAIVPADAQLWVDGTKTKQTGESRRFVSPPVPSGHVYVYHVRVVTDGRDVEKAVRVRAGDNINLDFTGAQVRESRGQPTATSTGASYYSPAGQGWYTTTDSRVKRFASQSPYGAYTWRPLPFPQWNDLAIPWPQR